MEFGGRAMADGMTLVGVRGGARKAGARALIATAGRNNGAVDAKGAAPRLQVGRADQWTIEKQELFVARLAETANVSASLVETGMSHAGLYKLRKRSATFRAAWDEALDLGYARVEAMLLDRALNGRRRVLREGVIVEEFVECSDSLALTLIAQHRKRVVEYRAAIAVSRDNPERLRERFMAKLQRLAKAAGWQG
jgi:hypothetical protein